jgi:hypothetical protein
VRVKGLASACMLRVTNQLVTCSSRPGPVSPEPSPGHMHPSCTCPSSCRPLSAFAHPRSTLRTTQRCINARADPETSLQLTPTFRWSTALRCFLQLSASRRQYSCCSPHYDSCTTCPDSCTTHRQSQTDSNSFLRALTQSSP